MAAPDLEALSTLLQAVASGRVTPERALEIARSGDAAALESEPSEAAGETLLSVTPTDRARKFTDKLPSLRPRRPDEPPPTEDELLLDERYRVLREFARGGMGRVLLAIDTTVGREIALKELLPERTGTRRLTSDGSSTHANIERFLREARGSTVSN